MSLTVMHSLSSKPCEGALPTSRKCPVCIVQGLLFASCRPLAQPCTLFTRPLVLYLFGTASSCTTLLQRHSIEQLPQCCQTLLS